MLGERFSAERALALGLVNAVLPDAELLAYDDDEEVRDGEAIDEPIPPPIQEQRMISHQCRKQSFTPCHWPL